jgi:hypothetical protein
VQLASSNEPDVRKEAWKAIRDDSPKTRAMFAYLAPEDAKELESCVKLALADKDERVRAAIFFRPVQRRLGIKAEWMDVETLISDPSPLVTDGLYRYSRDEVGFTGDQKKRIEARRATFLPEKMNFFNYEAFDFL